VGTDLPEVSIQNVTHGVKSKRSSPGLPSLSVTSGSMKGTRQHSITPDTADW